MSSDIWGRIIKRNQWKNVGFSLSTYFLLFNNIFEWYSSYI